MTNGERLLVNTISDLREENSKLKELLGKIRDDDKLWRINRIGGQDQYAGCPPFVRMIDVLLKSNK